MPSTPSTCANRVPVVSDGLSAALHKCCHCLTTWAHLPGLALSAFPKMHMALPCMGFWTPHPVCGPTVTACTLHRHVRMHAEALCCPSAKAAQQCYACLQRQCSNVWCSNMTECNSASYSLHVALLIYGLCCMVDCDGCWLFSWVLC